MNNKEWIIKYLERELFHEELIEFHKLIDTDVELAHQLWMYQQAELVTNESFGLPSKTELIEKWKRVVKSERRRKMYRIIVVLLLLGIIFTLFFWYNSPKPSTTPKPDYVAIAHDQWENGPQLNYNLRSGHAEADSNQIVIKRAIEFYHQKRYLETIHSLERIPNSHPYKADASLIQAVATYQLLGVEQASSLFEEIIQTQGSKKGFSIWFSALIDLERESS